MKAVVVGGSGFLGSHVADMLTARQYEVTIFDLRPSAYARANQRVVLGDLLDRQAVSAVLDGADVVYHLGGVVDLDDALTSPIETVQQNIVGTTGLLGAAVEAGVQRFIFASTVYVYSQLGGFYRCSKQAAELYIEEYERRYGLPYTILRYGTIYGPRADGRNSIYRFLHEGLLHKKIVYPGMGDEVREYIHVRDAAKLSVDILSDEFKNRHLLLTGHHPMRTKDMLRMIQEILNHEVAVEYGQAADTVHYTLTPYAFTPRIGHKLVSTCYVDMGQGLLECLHDIAEAADHSRVRDTSDTPCEERTSA